ncbi:MAG TPA: DegT/DnrJ/EryC1/StrS family aminotransferase [Allosphingosinicella sp.]|nr:DegT/DnrJ/EryC1/StrS family aminotransferase [Allosphingosinicella sp.]
MHNDLDFRTLLPKWPVYDHTEMEGLQRALSSQSWWRGSGQESNSFESEFAEFLGVSHVRLTSSGAGALEIALQLGGILPGDEVLVPACTFIATASAVLRLGGCPIPVDVTAETLCIDPADMEAKITRRTKAVVPVHMAGQACDLDSVLEISRRHGLFVIEDAAHAHGARWRGRPLGGFGDVAIFSFQNGKLMTSGEGGAVVTNRDDLAARTFLLHSCGRPEGDTDYEHREIAGNWRPTEFSAALLRAQLARLPGQLERREAGAARLDSAMARQGDIVPLRRDPRTTLHSHYMAMYWIDRSSGRPFDAGACAAELRGLGIPAFRCFPPVHKTGMFTPDQLKAVQGRSDLSFPDYSRVKMPVADRASTHVIWFHHSVLLAEPEVLDALAACVGEVLESRRLAA